MASKRRTETFCGYFLPSNQQVKDDDEECSDADDEDDWEDVDEIEDPSYRGFDQRDRPLKRNKLLFHNLQNGHRYSITGQFPLVDPWFEATITVGQNKSSDKFCIGHPCYAVRNDVLVAQEELVYIFLAKCGIHEDHRNAFRKFIERAGAKDYLTFENLPEILDQFGRNDGVNAEMVKQMNMHMKCSPAGQAVVNIQKYKLVAKYLPQMFPKQFERIVAQANKQTDEEEDGNEAMGEGDDEESENQKTNQQHKNKKQQSGSPLLDLIEKELKDKPWIFAFKKILCRDYQLFGMEAQLKHYENCKLLDEMSQPYKDAIILYDVLKKMMQKYGHTFVYTNHLATSKLLGQHQVRNAQDALEFMEKNEIIKSEDERVQNTLKTRIYLRFLYDAEVNIATDIETLYKQHDKSPWTLDIDLSSPRFGHLTGDEDQAKAASLIGRNPVVVISGKGGCGKTTVVSAVMKYAEEQLLVRQGRGFNTEAFDEEDEDDFDEVMLSQACQKAENEALVTNDNDTSVISNDSAILFDNDDESAVLETDSQMLDSQIDGDLSLLMDKIEADDDNDEAEQGPCNDGVNTEKTKAENNKKDEEYPEPPTLLDEPVVLLTAPTGKAANLIGKRAKLPSFTLHRVIYSYRMWMDNCRKAEREGQPEPKWKFSKVEALVVDECSLVGVRNFSGLVRCLLRHANLKKLVLLGDINQLPSIDPGYFLGNLFESLSVIGCSVLLRTNHRSEAALIVENASAIAQQREPVVDPSRHFYQIDIGRAGVENEDLSCERDAVVRDLLQGKHTDLVCDRKSQFVAFKNKDCDAINELCCRHYAKHSMKNNKGRKMFQIGDKVCCTKNGDVSVIDSYYDYPDKPYIPKKKTKKEREENANSEDGQKEEKEDGGEKVRLSNGEIFFIVDIIQIEGGSKKTDHYVLHDPDRKDSELHFIKVNFRELRKNCKLKHAWARTIHTYQGSEAETVVYVVGSPAYQNWQHVYTAVTRGRQQVVIITKPQNLTTVVHTLPGRRQTSLGERLGYVVDSMDRDAWPLCQPILNATPTTATFTNRGPTQWGASQRNAQYNNRRMPNHSFSDSFLPASQRPRNNNQSAPSTSNSRHGDGQSEQFSVTGALRKLPFAAGGSNSNCDQNGAKCDNSNRFSGNNGQIDSPQSDSFSDWDESLSDTVLNLEQTTESRQNGRLYPNLDDLLANEEESAPPPSQIERLNPNIDMDLAAFAEGDKKSSKGAKKKTSVRTKSQSNPVVSDCPPEIVENRHPFQSPLGPVEYPSSGNTSTRESPSRDFLASKNRDRNHLDVGWKSPKRRQGMGSVVTPPKKRLSLGEEMEVSPVRKDLQNIRLAGKRL